MDRISTPFLSFEDIFVSDIDLFSDAWDFERQIDEIFGNIPTDFFEPDDGLVSRIIAVL
ncbi:MAG TPA: hypothetical protein VMW76_08785 [Bacteroidales bacterium]|nr:hypothetical protein [Bacteroidales bacterium]